MSVHNISAAVVCVCLHITHAYQSLNQYTLPVCVHMSVHNISAAVVCVCLHITHAYQSLNQYTLPVCVHVSNYNSLITQYLCCTC